MADEINEEKLDSPMIVHKKEDASYSETAFEVDMSTTHSDEDENAPTLERHRFSKKKKKEHNKVWLFVALIAVVVAVICALFYSGKLSIGESDTTSTTVERTYTTRESNDFEGIITIKGTYIFFEGTEVDGLNGLERKIKYLDEGTKFTIQDEDADSNFLNYDVLSLLSQYGIDYEITHIVSSGLISQYETTSEKSTESTTETSSEQTSQ